MYVCMYVCVYMYTIYDNVFKLTILICVLHFLYYNSIDVDLYCASLVPRPLSRSCGWITSPLRGKRSPNQSRF